MDYYPQPRPVLYGTSAEDAPPQTQTAPVRVGPPRWPPAPPLAGDWEGDYGDDSSHWQSYLPADYKLSELRDARRGRFVVVTLYALASVYALYEVAFEPQSFATLSLLPRLFLLMQIVAVFWIVPSVLLFRRAENLLVFFICFAQLVLGIVAGELLTPGTVAALAVLLVLWHSSDVPSYLPRVRPRVRPRKTAHYNIGSGPWRRRSRVGKPDITQDDWHWRIRF